MDGRSSPAGNTASSHNAACSSGASTPAATPTPTRPRSGEEPRMPSPERFPRAPVSGDLRDATELGVVGSNRRDESPSTISSGSVRVVTQYSSRDSAQSSTSREPTGRFAPVKRFWKDNVVLSVEQRQSRDHFALERTFLAYIRTSVAFSMLGVFIAQLFTLHHTGNHDPEFGFFRVGVPLSCACFGVAIVVALIGAHRFWRQQSAMANSKVRAGGWELNMIGALATATVLVLFVLVIVISERKG